MSKTSMEKQEQIRKRAKYKSVYNLSNPRLFNQKKVLIVIHR